MTVFYWTIGLIIFGCITLFIVEILERQRMRHLRKQIEQYIKEEHE
jgi:hypothetical protein